MQKTFSDMPIKRKLTVIMLVTGVSVLLMAGAILVLAEIFTFRRMMVADLNSLSDVLGQNTSAALAFTDDKAAAETLSSLKAQPHIVAARVYDAQGNPFADYVRPGETPAIPARPETYATVFSAGQLSLFKPIKLNDKQIGTIYVQSSLAKLYLR